MASDLTASGTLSAGTCSSCWESSTCCPAAQLVPGVPYCPRLAMVSSFYNCVQSTSSSNTTGYASGYGQRHGSVSFCQPQINWKFWLMISFVIAFVVLSSVGAVVAAVIVRRRRAKSKAGYAGTLVEQPPQMLVQVPMVEAVPAAVKTGTRGAHPRAGRFGLQL